MGWEKAKAPGTNDAGNTVLYLRRPRGHLRGIFVIDGIVLANPGGDYPDPFNLKSQPVENAKVRVTKGVQMGSTSRTVSTNMHGLFDFGPQDPGSFTVEVSVDGLTRSFDLDVEAPGAKQAQTFDLGFVPPSKKSQNLFVGKTVVDKVAAKLTPNNKWSTFSSFEGWAVVVPGTVETYVAELVQLGNGASKDVLERIGDGYDANLDTPAPDCTAPYNEGFRAYSHFTRAFYESGQGNCGEMSCAATVECARQGLHPVEQFCLRDRSADGDHGICIVGRDLSSDCNDFTTWGPEAVVVDPWSQQCYPASELGDPKNMPCKKRNPPQLAWRMATRW
jgi:hypothetical protein